MKVSIGVSNRHVHLKQDDLNILFGDDYKLTISKNLNQYGQFKALEKVDIETDKNIIKGVSVVGPVRNYTQVEVSRSDCYFLGVDAPIRDSGDLDQAVPIKIIGPKGSIVRNSLIIANRHIHISHDDRVKYNLLDVDMVSVKIDGEKGGIMDNVYIKEDDTSFFEMHIDTDDANAFMLENGMEVEIIKK